MSLRRIYQRAKQAVRTRRDEEGEGGREFAQSEGRRSEEGVVGRGIMLNKPT